MIADANFGLVTERLFSLHEHGEYHQALDVVQAAAGQFPDHADRLSYWQACLECRLGAPEQAVATFEAGLGQGLWWAPEMLRHDPDLAPLQEQAAFAAVVRACEEQLAAAQATAVVRLRVERPARPHPGSPLLVALHWRLLPFEDFAARWEPAVHHGVVVALPRSSQQLRMRGFGWDDHDRATLEVADAYASLRETETVDPAKVILAGASQGATLAIRLALTGQLVPAKGFIAVVPALNSLDDLAQEIETASKRDVRGWIVTGERDDGRAAADALHARLTETGVRCQLEMVPGLGHDFPHDFASRLPAALDAVLA